MNCEQCHNLLVDYLYGELDDRTRDEVEAALETCADCRAELAALRRTGEAFDALPALEMPARLHNDIVRAARLQVAEAAPHRNRWAAFFASPAFGVAFSVALLAGGGLLFMQLTYDEGANADFAEVTTTAALEDSRGEESPTGGIEPELAEEEEAAPEFEPALEGAVDGLRAQEGRQSPGRRGGEAATAVDEAPGRARGLASNTDEDSERSNNALSGLGEQGGALGAGGSASTRSASGFGAGRSSGGRSAGGDDLGGMANMAQPDAPAPPAAAAPAPTPAEPAPEPAQAQQPMPEAEPVWEGQAATETVATGSLAADSDDAAGPVGSETDGFGGYGDAPNGSFGLEANEDAHVPSADRTVAESRGGARAARRRDAAEQPAAEQPAVASAAPMEEVAEAEETEESARDGELIAALDREAEPDDVPTVDNGYGATGVDDTWTSAVSYYDGGDYRSAATRLDAFLAAASPDDARRPEALYYAATANLRIGRDAAARSLLERFLAAYPGHAMAADARVLLDDIEERANTEPVRQRSESLYDAVIAPTDE